MSEAAKTLIGVLMTLLTLSLGAWVTNLHSRIGTMESRVEETAKGAGRDGASQGSRLTALEVKLDSFEKNVERRLESIEKKLDEARTVSAAAAAKKR